MPPPLGPSGCDRAALIMPEPRSGFPGARLGSARLQCIDWLAELGPVVVRARHLLSENMLARHAPFLTGTGLPETRDGAGQEEAVAKRS